jgi:hypothetical protein
MLDIYDADGHLDRGRVLDELNEVLLAPGTRISAATRASAPRHHRDGGRCAVLPWAQRQLTVKRMVPLGFGHTQP